MMVISQRQQLHLNVAVYYERMLDANNRTRLLIPLYEHYSETDDKQILKKLSYLEAIAHTYFENDSMGEAIKHYTNLLEKADMASNLPSPVVFDPTTKSTWLRELGEAYYMKGDDQNCEQHLLQCLKLLEHPFPKNPILLEWKLYGQSVKRNKFPVEAGPETLSMISAESSSFHDAGTGNGSIMQELKPSTSQGSFNGNNADRIVVTNMAREDLENDPLCVALAEMITNKHFLGLHNVRRALATLSQIYLNTGQIKEHRYAVLKGVNISQLFPHDSLYAKFLAMSGALSWYSDGKKRMSLRYLEAASKFDQRYDLAYTVSIVLSTALTLFLMGKWGSSMRRLSAIPFLEMMSGDCSMRAEALRMRAIVIHLSGARSQSIKASRDLHTIAAQEGNWEGMFWGSKLIIANLLTVTGNDSEIVDLTGKLRELWKRIPDEHRGDPLLGINFLAFTSEADYRLNVGFDLDAFLGGMATYTADLKNLNNFKNHSRSANASSAWGGGAASAGGPHYWLSGIGLIHAGSLIMNVYNERETLKNDSKFRRTVGKIAKDVETWLGTGQIMRNMTLTHPIRYLFKGIRYMIKNKAAPKACAAWKKGLSCRRVSDLIWVRGVLHFRIAQNSTSNSEANHHAHEAQKLLRRIGSSYDFDKATLLRKDKKKKGSGSKRGGPGSGRDMNEDFSETQSRGGMSGISLGSGYSFDARSELN
jgi:hypothetical protein